MVAEAGSTPAETWGLRDPWFAGEIGRIWNVDAVEVAGPAPTQGDPLGHSQSFLAAMIQK
jgi:hypothetical protein